MKADEIQDILTLQELLADHDGVDVLDANLLAALITWKYSGNGVVVDSDTTARRKSPPPTEPKRGPSRPRKVDTPVPKPPAPVEDPDF